MLIYILIYTYSYFFWNCIISSNRNVIHLYMFLLLFLLLPCLFYCYFKISFHSWIKKKTEEKKIVKICNIILKRKKNNGKPSTTKNSWDSIYKSYMNIYLNIHHSRIYYDGRLQWYKNLLFPIFLTRYLHMKFKPKKKKRVITTCDYMYS